MNGKPYNRYAEGVTYVPALPERRPLALSEAPGRGDLLPAALGLAGQGQHTGHARQDDDAVLAWAALLVATGYAGRPADHAGPVARSLGCFVGWADPGLTMFSAADRAV